VLSRCSAVAGRELSSFKIFSFGPVFIDSLLQFRLIGRRFIFTVCRSRLRRYRCSASYEIPPSDFSASPGLQKPLSNSVLILCCVAGRPIEATQAFQPDSISISGGKAGNVDQALGIRDCLFVEGGDPGGKRIDKPVEIGIRQRTIHVAVALGQLAWARRPRLDYFELRVSLPMRRDSRAIGPPPGTKPAPTSNCDKMAFFATRKTHVASKGKLTPHTSRSPPNQCYRHDRCTTQAHEHFGPWVQACGSRREARQISQVSQEKF